MIPDQLNQHPCTRREWRHVEKIAYEIVRASGTDNELAQKRGLKRLRRYLATLRVRYGEHPALLETLGDFEDDPTERCRLYIAACESALKWGLSTAPYASPLPAFYLRNIMIAMPHSSTLQLPRQRSRATSRPLTSTRNCLNCAERRTAMDSRVSE